MMKMNMPLYAKEYVLRVVDGRETYVLCDIYEWDFFGAYYRLVKCPSGTLSCSESNYGKVDDEQ